MVMRKVSYIIESSISKVNDSLPKFLEQNKAEIIPSEKTSDENTIEVLIYHRRTGFSWGEFIRLLMKELSPEKTEVNIFVKLKRPGDGSSAWRTARKFLNRWLEPFGVTPQKFVKYKNYDHEGQLFKDIIPIIRKKKKK